MIALPSSVSSVASGGLCPQSLKCLLYPVDITGMNVIPPQVDVLGNMLSVTMLNHQVISQNIANVNTPDFHGRVVPFEEKLLNEVRNHKGDAPLVLHEFIQETNTPGRVDGNNVDLDLELSRLNRNAVFHQTLLQLMSGQLRLMRTAITGR